MDIIIDREIVKSKNYKSVLPIEQQQQQPIQEIQPEEQPLQNIEIPKSNTYYKKLERNNE